MPNDTFFTQLSGRKNSTTLWNWIRNPLRVGLIITLFFSQASALPPVINEIGWMGTDHSPYDEWIELYNPSQIDIDLTHWNLTSVDGSPNITLNGVIKADDFFVLERTDETTLSIGSDQIYTGSLSNSGEEIILLNPNGHAIDQTPAGSWAGGSNSKPKQSLERINAFQGTGANTNNWGTTEATASTIIDASGNTLRGTPGSYNSISPAKPRPIVDFNPSDFSITVLKAAPTSLGTTKEWFSLYIQSNSAIDLTDWSIRRGSHSKKISDILHHIHWNESHFPDGNLTSKLLDYIQYPADRFILFPRKNNSNEAWLYEGVIYLSPSPITLPDSGGIIEILDDQNEVVSSFVYPKTKKGTRSGQKYAEIWHQDPSGEIFPLLTWESDDIPILQKNFVKHRPTLPENLSIKISEISLNGGDQSDFIELYVAETPSEGANVRDLQVTQNGTEVLGIKEDLVVQTGDFIIIKFGDKSLNLKQSNQTHIFTGTGKQSLADSNGTLTVKLWSKTSWEIIEDFWCWKKPNTSPSNAMIGRINKAGSEQANCFGTQKSTTERMSWAKDFLNPVQSPSDQEHEIKKHYLGSPGQINYWPNPINIRPKAYIQVQSITNQTININGDNSYDYNGNYDIKSVDWTLLTENILDRREERKELLSYKLNPSTFHLDQLKSFTDQQCKNTKLTLQLRIYDYHHKSGKKKLSLPIHWDEEHCSLKPPKTERIIINSNKFLPEEKTGKPAKDFFSDVMAVIQEAYKDEAHQTLITQNQTDVTDHDILENISEPLTAREILFDTYPQITPELLKKNIGWAIYSGR